LPSSRRSRGAPGRDAEGFVVPPGSYTVYFTLKLKDDGFVSGAWRSVTVVD
jgi:hypothetical protein